MKEEGTMILRMLHSLFCVHYQSRKWEVGRSEERERERERERWTRAVLIVLRTLEQPQHNLHKELGEDDPFSYKASLGPSIHK